MRPKLEYAKQASCVPYDVVYTSEVREFVKKNPLSFLRVTRAEAEFEDETKVSKEEIFARAKANLEEFINKELFFQEDEPCIYVYQLSIGDHTQTGVVACCSVDEYESSVIKKHEKTRPDKVEDRTEHMLALNAQTGLIFLAFRNTATIRELLKNTVEEKPIYKFHCNDGVQQIVWKISDTEKWIEAFEEVPNLYIADGHHRAESSLLTRNTRRDKNPNHTGKENYNYVLTGMYPAEDLAILAYNRVVKDLNGLSEDEFLQGIKQHFVITGEGQKESANPREFCMYLNGKWRTLEFSVEFDREPDPIERLDVSILQQFLLEPILGIGDARVDQRIGFVGGARGTAELERVVDEGMAKVAFSMFPTTMKDLFDVSDIDEIMPPKSTWFEPKLKDGLLVYLI